MEAQPSGNGGMPGLMNTEALPDFLSSTAAGGSEPAAPSAPAGEAGPAGGASAPSKGAESVAAATTGTGQQALPGDGTTPTPEPFEIAGKSYPSREAAEQELRSMLGRVPALQKQLADMERSARDAATIARQWKEYAEQSGQRQGQSPQEPATPKEPDKPWYESGALDFDLVQEIAEEKGLANAMFYVVEQIDQHYTKLLDTRLAERVAPFEAQSAQHQQFNAVMGHFSAAANEADGSGNPTYPELHDERTAADVVRVWRDIVTEHPTLAQSPRGVQLAILQYRATNGAPAPLPKGGTPAPAGASGVADGVLRNAAAAAHAAAGSVVTGNGSPRPAAPGTPATSFKDLVGGAPTVRTPGGMDLGFAPHVS